MQARKEAGRRRGEHCDGGGRQVEGRQDHSDVLEHRQLARENGDRRRRCGGEQQKARALGGLLAGQPDAKPNGGQREPTIGSSAKATDETAQATQGADDARLGAGVMRSPRRRLGAV